MKAEEEEESCFYLGVRVSVLMIPERSTLLRQPDDGSTQLVFAWKMMKKMGLRIEKRPAQGRRQTASWRNVACNIRGCGFDLSSKFRVRVSICLVSFQKYTAYFFFVNSSIRGWLVQLVRICACHQHEGLAVLWSCGKSLESSRSHTSS